MMVLRVVLMPLKRFGTVYRGSSSVELLRSSPSPGWLGVGCCPCGVSAAVPLAVLFCDLVDVVSPLIYSAVSVRCLVTVAWFLDPIWMHWQVVNIDERWCQVTGYRCHFGTADQIVMLVSVVKYDEKMKTVTR